jgi:DNA-binding transcriptional LysR family regulator
VFLRYARDDRALAERVRSELDALKGLRRGMVRIWAIESVAQEVLPRAIARFTESNPGIRFEVTVTSTEEVIAAVQDVRADLGVAFQPQVPADLRVSFRIRHPLHAIMSARHPLAGIDRISIVETLSYPIALNPPGSGSRMLIDATVSAAGAVLVPTLESNSVRLLTHFASEATGITFLSRFCGSPELRSGELKSVRLRDRLMNVARLEILTQAARTLPTVAEQFQNHLRRELQAGPRN